MVGPYQALSSIAKWSKYNPPNIAKGKAKIILRSIAFGVRKDKYKAGRPEKNREEIKKFVLNFKEIKTANTGNKINKMISIIFFFLSVKSIVRLLVFSFYGQTHPGTKCGTFYLKLKSDLKKLNILLNNE
jgi:hypothetical protein